MRKVLAISAVMIAMLVVLVGVSNADTGGAQVSATTYQSADTVAGSGNHIEIVVYCQSGEYVTGGGYDFSIIGPQLYNKVHFVVEAARPVAIGNQQQYVLRAYNNSDDGMELSFRAFASCLHVAYA